MEKLVILDYSTGEVDIYNTQFEDGFNADDVMKQLGHNPDDCLWMYAEGQITFHKEVLR